MIKNKDKKRKKKKVHGNELRPRLVVKITNKNIYAQIINDEVGKTLIFVSSMSKEFNKSCANIKTAQLIGIEIGKKAKEKNIEKVVFDRNGHPYHGKIKALADSARELGLKF